MLAEHRETVNTDADAPMFPSPGGQPWEHSNLIRRVFHPALKRAKIRRIRFHDLRHTYAALMVSRNANLKWLQGQMGHASITTTLDLYGHLLPDTGAGAPDALGALISGEVSTVGVSKSGFEEKTGDNMVTSEDSEAEVQ
jgi:integrase